MKNKKKKRKVITIILVLVVIAVAAATYYFGFYNKAGSVKTIDKIDKYGYSLNSNATQYHKKLFSELKTILNKSPIDEEEYAKKVSQIFLADLFTLSNKMTNSDVGGIDFIYSDYKNDYISTVQNGLYKHIKNKLYKNRNQSLPEVSEVGITSTKQDKFTYNKKEYDSYVVSCTISYKQFMGYPEKYTLVLIKNNNKLEIAKGSE